MASPLIGNLFQEEKPSKPKEPTERQRIRDEAKYQMRNATERWISGRMTTADHSAVHARARHVLSGKHPNEFRGKTGEQKGKSL